MFKLSPLPLARGQTGLPILGNTLPLNIPSCVNASDKSYQKAYSRFRVRLVQARQEAGLTQAEVARRLGRAHSFISKCELGERRVDFIELQQLARIYKKDLSFFHE
jgi:DNA-binding XRE family transcriptional regulator